MTRHQERTLTMLLVVSDYLKAHTAVTATIPTFPSLSASFFANIDAIRAISQTQSNADSRVDSQTKKDLRDACFAQIQHLLDVLKAHALITINLGLEQQVSTPLSDYIKAADTTFATQCDNVYTIGHNIAADLVQYGMNAAFFTKFRHDIDAYIIAIPKPRATMINRADSTRQLATLFETALQQLNHTTILMSLKRLSDPIIYHKYIESTHIIEAGSRTQALRCSIKADDGMPLRGFSFQFIGATSNKVYNFKSNINGTIVRQSLSPDTYTVTISHKNFASLTGQITIMQGTTFVLDATVNMTDKTIASSIDSSASNAV